MAAEWDCSALAEQQFLMVRTTTAVPPEPAACPALLAARREASGRGEGFSFQRESEAAGVSWLLMKVLKLQLGHLEES